MKKSSWLFLFIMAACFACKDEDAEAPNAISEQEAAVMVASSFASNSSGVSFVSNESALKSQAILKKNASGRIATCGVSQSIILSGASPAGGAITWSYDFNYNFQLNCNVEELPENIAVGLSYRGAFDSPKSRFEHAGLSELAITGLEASADVFLMNGLYKRSGSFEIKDGEKKAGSSSIDITITNVAIDKHNHKIISGSSSFILTGSVSGKGAFKYEGIVEFKGNDTADLKFKREVFLLNLKDGSIKGK